MRARRPSPSQPQAPALALALLLGVAAVTAAAPARAQPAAAAASDPAFGPDKALHFGAGFGLAAVGYGVGVAALEHRWAGLALGGGVALGLSGLKEALDAAGLGTPDWRDFVWGVAGTALGLGVSITFDAALRGP